MSSDRFDDKNIPPWLRGVPLPPRPKNADADAPSASSPKADSSEISAESPPGWLRELGDTPPAAPPSSELPPWLRETPEETRASSAEQSALPDWLRDIQADRTPTETDAVPPVTPSADSLPDWLRDAGPSEPAPTPGIVVNESLPDWLRESPSNAEQPTSADAEEETPDWLRSLAEDSAAEQPVGPAGEKESIPNWLDDIAQPSPSPYDTLQMPGLSGAEDASEIEKPAPPSDDDFAVAPFSFDADMPDGASLPQPSEGGSRDTTDATPFGWLPDTSDADAGSYDAQDVPAWLRDIRADADVAPAEPNVPASPLTRDAPDEAPLWLDDVQSAGQDTDIPPWLRDDDQPAAEKTDTISAPTSEEMPAWLRDMGEQTGQSPTADDMPAWLQDAETEEAADQPVASDTGEMPAWLRDAGEQPAQSPRADDMPSWLRDAGEQTGQSPTVDDMPVTPAWFGSTNAEPTQEQPAASESEDVPEWLRGASSTEDAALVEDTQPGTTTPAGDAETPTNDDLPSWLRSSEPDLSSSTAEQVPPWLRAESGSPLPSADAHAEAGLPEYLRGAADEPDSRSTAGNGRTTNFDWFDEETEPGVPNPVAMSDAHSLESGIELPAWLRPPEPEAPKEEISPSDARSLDWLTRLGGQEEDDTVAVAAIAAPRLKPPILPQRTPAQVEALALLERLAAIPFPDAAPTPVAAETSVLRRIGAERLLYVVLLIAVIVALLVPVPGWLGLSEPPVAPGADALFTQLDRLGENDVVLVGYEWDARRSSELRPLERAVMGHLIQHKVKMVLVSTDPQGTLLLFDLRDQLADAGYRGGGEDYVLLGYKPGAELALRSMAQNFSSVLGSDFQGNDATQSALVTGLATGRQPLTKLSDFSQIIVLADEPADVQAWMEQIRHAAQKPDGSEMPFALLLPNEAEPIVQPYLALNSVEHLAGRQGAMVYQSLRGGTGLSPEQVSAQTSQQRITILAYLVLLIVGAIVVGVASAMNRRRA